ncbi:potassium voltage-gated channel protein Shaw-like [Argopecten irradians]|uniref:potassium voltage-gated channel protein Shaw-like n=1 Tax=Argopecten irradians TaxID=31199 RepID=UPI0037159F71
MNYNNMDEKIKFNIRGTTFVTRRSTLDNLIPSRLSRLTKESSEYEKNTDEYFYDRSPSFFNWILDIHSSGEIHVPSWMCSVRALQELEFWEISCKVQPCCWKTLYENDNGILESMMVMDNDEIASRGSEVWPEKTHGRVCSPVIKVLRDAYDHPFKSRTGKVFFSLALMLTLTSIFTYALSVHSFTRVIRSDAEIRQIYLSLGYSMYDEDYPNLVNELDDTSNETQYDDVISNSGGCGDEWFNAKVKMFGLTRMHPVLWYTEVIVNGLLLIEFIVRLLIARGKFCFLRNPLNVCDLMSIIAFVFVICLEENPAFFINERSKPILMILGIIYTTRTLRILRLAFAVDEMKILVYSLKSSLRMLSLLLICFAVFSILFGSLMYSFEIFSNDTFENVFISVWWALITMTTVGYGDEYPKTPQGYVLGSITTMFGVVLIAMPIAILSTNFATYYGCYKLKSKAKVYKHTPCKKRDHCKAT